MWIFRRKKPKMTESEIELDLQHGVDVGLLLSWERLELPYKAGLETKMWRIVAAAGWDHVLGSDYSAPGFIRGMKSNKEWGQ